MDRTIPKARSRVRGTVPRHAKAPGTDALGADGGASPVAGAAASQPVAAAPRKGRVRAIVLVALFLVGAAIMLYPAYSYLYAEYMNARTAAEYQQAVDEQDEAARTAALEQARAYNASHTVNEIFDPFGEEESKVEGSAEYRKMLALGDDGMMACLEIPKIGQTLPVYHGASTKVLDKGIGHLPGTSLPVGGKGSHCVLSGHRGLPTKKLFTDLDQLAAGDKVYLHVLGEHLAYEVESVAVVKPTQVDGLAIQPGRDLLTLVTCTPYAVNTHRMLVTGHRVPYEPEQDATGAFDWLAAFSPQTLVLAGAFSLVVLAGLVVLVRRLKRRDR